MIFVSVAHNWNLE